MGGGGGGRVVVRLSVHMSVVKDVSARVYIYIYDVVQSSMLDPPYTLTLPSLSVLYIYIYMT